MNFDEKAREVAEWLNGEIGVMPNSVFRQLVSAIHPGDGETHG
jgi:hypothetical protein